jgi:multiple antibiotic resistance protein
MAAETMSTWWFALRALAAIFVIVDPLGNVPFFVASTGRLSVQRRRRLAWEAGFVAALVLLVFAAAGRGILSLFQIELPALRIGGGIVLLVVAVRILSGRQFGWEEPGQPAGEATAVVPIAIPLMAGPGAMTTTLVLVEQSRGWFEFALVGAAIIVVCLLGAVCYRWSGWLIDWLGRTVIVIVSTFAGLLLAVLAMQFVLDGLQDAFGWGLQRTQ